MRKQWTSRIAAAFGLWLVVCVVAQLLGNQPRPGLIALVIGAAATTAWLYLDTSAQSEPARWQLVSDEPIRPPGSDPRLSLFERVIAQHLDSRDATDQLHRYVSETTERRLVTKHGINRATDPERARAVLGPELAGFLDNPRSRRLSLSEIDSMLTRIEAL